MARIEPLEVWLDGLHVAQLIPRRPWRLQCRYTEAALERWPGLSPVLSCSLPLQRRPMDASVFAAGLLPEGRHRQALAAELKVAVNDIYALLARFGRDVAGALIIAPELPPARDPHVLPYTAATLEQEILRLPEHPLAIHDDSELSIAGLQDKLLLVAMPDGGWGRPVHGYPSTHILKLDDPIRPGLVRGEAACLMLAERAGLSSAKAQVLQIAGTDCLLVSRFDRQIEADGSVRRIHQEDLCQALARDPDANRGRGKYQDAGGPSLADAARLLDRYAADPQAELRRLLAGVTFTVLIGNADAHAKNLALLHDTPETVRLAPLYDTVPTVLWPRLRTRAAMSIAGHWELATITTDHLVREAESWPLQHAHAQQVIRHTTETVLAATAELQAQHPLTERVIGRAERLLGDP